VVADKTKEMLGNPRPRPANGVGVTVAADERTNTVIVSGPADKIALAKRFIGTLDQPPPSEGISGEQIYFSTPGLAECVADCMCQYHGGCVVEADVVRNALVVRGTPLQIFDIKRTIKELRPENAALRGRGHRASQCSGALDHGWHGLAKPAIVHQAI
jgi:hypothetical protein